jgi:hypothetical protein
MDIKNDYDDISIHIIEKREVRKYYKYNLNRQVSLHPIYKLLNGSSGEDTRLTVLVTNDIDKNLSIMISRMTLKNMRKISKKYVLSFMIIGVALSILSGLSCINTLFLGNEETWKSSATIASIISTWISGIISLREVLKMKHNKQKLKDDRSNLLDVIDHGTFSFWDISHVLMMVIMGLMLTSAEGIIWTVDSSSWVGGYDFIALWLSATMVNTVTSHFAKSRIDSACVLWKLSYFSAEFLPLTLRKGVPRFIDRLIVAVFMFPLLIAVPMLFFSVTNIIIDFNLSSREENWYPILILYWGILTYSSLADRIRLKHSIDEVWERNRNVIELYDIHHSVHTHFLTEMIGVVAVQVVLTVITLSAKLS